MTAPNRIAQHNECSPPAFGDYGPDEVHQALQQVAKYIADAGKRPLCGPWNEGQIAALVSAFPEKGCDIDTTMALFRNTIAPGLLRWNSPRFMGYFATSSPLPSIVASTLITHHNSNRMIRSASPAAAELDLLASKWYGKFLNVPEIFEGQLYYGASQSHMHALSVSLNRKTNGRFRQEGLGPIGKRFRIYKSELAHFFVEKNAIAVGIGLDNVVAIPVNDVGEMVVTELSLAIERDLREGYQPLMVVATVGTTSVTSVDPVSAIAELCDETDLYLYVDAAYAGAFAALPEFSWLIRGWDRADAICINPHKQLMVPLGCSLLFVKDRNELRRTCAQTGAYIPEVDDCAEPMDYTFYCGMPINSLAPIFNLLVFGAEGLRSRLQRTIQLARAFAQLIEDDPDFEIVAPYAFSTICFRANPRLVRDDIGVNKFNEWIHERVCSQNDIFVSKAKLKDKTILRLTVGNINTSMIDILDAHTILRRAAGEAGRLFSFRLLCDRSQPVSRQRGSTLDSLWSRIPAELITSTRFAPEA
jgi:aromatic-L-amino-acid decarboxylase